jgi:hypothetical protein
MFLICTCIISVHTRTLHEKMKEMLLLVTLKLMRRVVGIKMLFVSASDRLCVLVVRVLGCRSGGPGSIPGTTRKKNVVGLELGALSLVSTN